MQRVFHVYHATSPSFDEATPAQLAQFPEGFVHVATVRAAEVGAVFELTNTIDAPWWQHDGITLTVAARDGARSSSVGDVFVRGDGARWAVDRIGLRRF